MVKGWRTVVRTVLKIIRKGSTLVRIAWASGLRMMVRGWGRWCGG